MNRIYDDEDEPEMSEGERALARAYAVLEQKTPEPEPPPQPVGMPTTNTWWPPEPEPPPRERSTKTERSPAMNGSELTALVRATVRDEIGRALEQLKREIADTLGKVLVAERVHNREALAAVEERTKTRSEFYDGLLGHVRALQREAPDDGDGPVLDFADERRRRGNA